MHACVRACVCACVTKEREGDSLGPLRSTCNRISVVEAVPIRTETVCKQTEAVRKRSKYGVHLYTAG